MKTDNRFIVTCKEGFGFGLTQTVLVDRQTGVNYLYVTSGYSGGLTVLLDKDGKPVVSAVNP